MRLAALLIVAATCGAGGCGKPKSAQSSTSTPARAPAVAPTVVEGSVRLAEGYGVPSYVPESMEKKVLDHVSRAALPEVCTPPKTADRQPVKLSSDGLLSGVMLAASGFSSQFSRPPTVHEVVIRDCRLEPALVVAMKGDTLRVRNDVDYPFMPTLDQYPVARTLTRGQTYEVALDKPGVLPLLCGFTAPCGRADVVVMLHPFYTVTDASGSFRFPAFPDGESVTLSAWHPLFRETKQEVKVERGEHKRLEITLTPLAPATANASEPAPGAQRQRSRAH
jgi:hypothetical protein